MNSQIGILFPTVRTGSGTDIFTIRLSKSLKKKGIRTHISWINHPSEYLPWAYKLPKFPPWANIVHANSWLHGRFIPKSLPLVVTMHHCVHDPILDKYKNIFQKIYHRIWINHCEREMIRRANTVTAVSDYTNLQIERFFGHSNAITIYNWIDTEKFTPPPPAPPHTPFRLLYVGNLNKRKGADLLGKIMQSLGPRFELRITCNQTDYLKHFPHSTNITPLGRKKTEREIIDTYRDSDALLFPSRLEGFGLVALEAQACGIPVITTNGSSLPEVVKDDVSGILCPQDDVESFANAAIELYTKHERFYSMKLASRLNAKNNFSENMAIEKYIKIYEKIIDCH